jgi:3-dehydro-L-gulonate 2-dehydrogenase
MSQEIRISFDEMQSTFYDILIKEGFTEDKAETCARVYAENSVDGVYTHGVNRFSRFIKNVRDKHVIIENEPVLKTAFGAFEQWDGQSGPGILNALSCTNRAIEIATNNGIGCVALAHTNHWMRGGTYGWEAAKKGFAFICWTNTIANMPAWGAKDSRLGNNPLIIAIPYKDEAIVLDMAISQFSFGKIELKKIKGEMLPVAGGFDENDELSTNPESILKTNRAVPIGYWKGSGLALLLDILATILSGGLSTNEITKQPAEIMVSQVFIAININKLHNSSAIAQALEQIIKDYKASLPLANADDVRYPGESVVKTRRENMEKGIPVTKQVWDEIMKL